MLEKKLETWVGRVDLVYIGREYCVYERNARDIELEFYLLRVHV